MVSHFTFEADELPTVEGGTYGEWFVGGSSYPDYTVEEAEVAVLEAIALYRHLKALDHQRRVDFAAELIADGASITMVAESVGFSRRKIKRLFPDAGWSKSEGGKLAAQMREAGLSRSGRIS